MKTLKASEKKHEGVSKQKSSRPADEKSNKSIQVKQIKGLTDKMKDFGQICEIAARSALHSF